MSLTSSSTASDVKRGQNLEAEAEAGAGAEAKIITKKYQIMINNLHNI